MSSNSSGKPSVGDFRLRLRHAVAELPRSEREQLLEPIDAHLEEALSTSSIDAEVREVLDDLGSPEMIADAAGAPLGASPRPPYHAFVALVVLTVGSVLLPLIGWVAGVVLLWASSRWTLAQKWLGTLVWPGGIGLVLIIGATAFGSPSSGFYVVPGTALVVLLFAAPVLVAIYLGSHIRATELI
ncbi:MAG TPA: hypothetical protein VMW80_08865 [Candidatus Dormibacteraeota bacterium]|nr:hypothetical protein [Candidatus Dormibacteraeota bacterium]